MHLSGKFVRVLAVSFIVLSLIVFFKGEIDILAIDIRITNQISGRHVNTFLKTQASL